MKKVQIHKSFSQAEKAILEEGFKRTPEERILWLMNHQWRTDKFSKNRAPSGHFQLRKKNG